MSSVPTAWPAPRRRSRSGGRRPISGIRNPRLVLAVGVLFLSWSSIWILLCDAPALVIAFFRMAGATVLLIPFLAIRPHRPLSPKTRRSALLAGCFLALHFAAWIHAVQITTVASAVVLVSTQPWFAAVLGRLFLRERIGAGAGIGILSAFVGMAMIAAGDLGGGARHFTGDLLALAAALFGAIYLMIGRENREEVSFIPYLFRVYWISAVVLGGMLAAFRLPLYPYPAPTYFWMAMLAVGCSLIGHGSLNWAVRSLRVYLVNLAILLEPVLATLYALFLFGQRPGFLTVAGAGLVLIGLAIAFLAESRTGNRGEPVPGAL